MLHEDVSRILAQRAGAYATANAVAEATVSTLHQAAVQLASVIGAKGVHVLLRRSLHLTGKTHPWLAVSTEDNGIATLLAGIEARLAGQPTAAAMEAGTVLLVTFTVLLVSLIGESLTRSLLAPIWPAPAAESEQESTP
jgi:hypothetical protein